MAGPWKQHGWLEKPTGKPRPVGLRNPLKSGVVGNRSKWCGWRGSNPRPLASEGRTFHWTVVSVSLDFQWFCGGTVECLSGFRKTHQSTQQHISLLNQTLSELQNVVVRSHVLRDQSLDLFETQLFVWFVLFRINWWKLSMGCSHLSLKFDWTTPPLNCTPEGPVKWPLKELVS